MVRIRFEIRKISFFPLQASLLGAVNKQSVAYTFLFEYENNCFESNNWEYTKQIDWYDVFRFVSCEKRVDAIRDNSAARGRVAIISIINRDPAPNDN